MKERQECVAIIRYSIPQIVIAHRLQHQLFPKELHCRLSVCIMINLLLRLFTNNVGSIKLWKRLDLTLVIMLYRIQNCFLIDLEAYRMLVAMIDQYMCFTTLKTPGARIPPSVATIDFQYPSFRHGLWVATPSGSLSTTGNYFRDLYAAATGHI